MKREYIWYMYIVRKYKIYLYKLYKQVEKWVFGDLFQPVSQRVQIHFIFNNNVRILCLYCYIKKSTTNVKLSENIWNKRRSNRFQWRHLWCQHLYVTVSSCRSSESGTSNALLGPWLNNTEVYLTPFISTQNHTIVW
jgi:hypothetical protein